MAECFWPGITLQKVEAAGARAYEVSRGLQPAGRCARHRGSILIPTDEIALFLLDARSLGAATELARQAAIPAERILEVVRLAAFASPVRADTPTPQRSFDDLSS